MKTKDACPLEQVASCRNVPEHHDPVALSGLPFQPGHLLDGRFQVMEVLSRSGMATIFKAEDRHNDGQLVAVKVPHLEYESDPNFFSRFQREERIGLALKHPYLLRCIPVENKSRHYIVSEYLKGCTLEHLLKAARPCEVRGVRPRGPPFFNTFLILFGLILIPKAGAPLSS